MRILFFKVGKRKKHDPELNDKKIERYLLISFAATFSILILAQTALMMKSSGNIFLVGENMEGTPLGVEEYLYEEGELVLSLVGDLSCSNLNILINGSCISAFGNQSVKLRVKNGDVIELDASAVDRSIQVKIVDITDNLSRELLNKSVILNSEIGILTKVRFKQ